MIYVIVGPTGVGKSKLAIKLAEMIKGEIINGDAFQSYRQLNVGTAKPDEIDFNRVKHHLYSNVNIDEDFTIYQYQKALRNKIAELSKKKIPIIICGGSGLYLKAGLYDFELKTDAKADVSCFDNYTNEQLHQELEKIDSEEAKKIHMNNRKRVLRALEIYRAYGKPKSEVIAEQSHQPIYPVTFIGLTRERKELYQLIDSRVDSMVSNGLFEEVKELIKNYPSDLRAFQAIGYKEIINGINKNLSQGEIIETIKKNTRNYAKRQYTYFSNQFIINWFSNAEEALEYCRRLEDGGMA